MLEKIIYKIRPQHSSPINFDNSNKLIQDIIHANITHEEALNKMADIDNNFKKITELNSFNHNQIKVANTYFMVSGIFTGEAKESVENNEGKLIPKKSNVIILINKENQTQQDKDLPSNQMNNKTQQMRLN